MTYTATQHVIHTRADGLLASTAPADVTEIARRAARADRVVIHFHGGLVSSRRGFQTAERLAAEYQKTGAYPVFFVWSSGLVETVTGNLREILVEDLGQRLLRWVLRFTVGKLGQDESQRAAGGLTLPYEMEVNAELRGRELGNEPYAGLPVPGDVGPVQPEEREQLEQAVATDETLAAELEAILAERRPGGSRGVTAGQPRKTLLSPEVLDELDPGDGSRGVVSTALLAKKVAAVFAAVVARFRAGTDHGVYPTVVEELLRELYLANVGAAVWAAMKKDTADTFVADSKDRGGAMFLDEFAAALDQPPRLSLVGHSTGAVFIDNFLDAVSRHPGLAAQRLQNVVLLAPACTFGHLAEALRHERLVEQFRLFSMDDATERADHLIPGLYPRSLLYLVSGLLERDPSGASAVVPVAGLQRYYLDDRYADMDGVKAVRAYATAVPDRLVWSPSAACKASSHSSFDEDVAALQSIGCLL